MFNYYLCKKCKNAWKEEFLKEYGRCDSECECGAVYSPFNTYKEWKKAIAEAKKNNVTILNFINGKKENKELTHARNEMVVFSHRKDKRHALKINKRKIKYLNGKPYFRFMGVSYDL